jgi:two-component SAPR family response regulator
MSIKIEKIILITSMDDYGLGSEGTSALDEIIKQIGKSKYVTLIDYENPIELQLKEKSNGLPKI